MNSEDRQAYGILANVAAAGILPTIEIPARGYDMNIGRHLRIADSLELVIDKNGAPAYKITKEGRRELDALALKILTDLAR